MTRRTIPMTLLALLLGASAALAAGAQPAPQSTAELKTAIGSKKTPVIVFFMNPYGMPCNAQNAILLDLQEARKKDFQIAYVRTDRPADQQAFYDYGVRSLPALVLVSRGGLIKRVFPPGIQKADILGAALDGVRD
ncbi:MAG TPA: thioredoxin family protein [bacterium]